MANNYIADRVERGDQDWIKMIESVRRTLVGGDSGN